MRLNEIGQTDCTREQYRKYFLLNIRLKDCSHSLYSLVYCSVICV